MDKTAQDCPKNKESKMVTKTTIEKRPTDLKHVFLIDWHDDGILKEIALVMETNDGTLFGIEVDKLHPIDKSRLKKVITSVHADKYPLWELLSQSRLSNGLNGLDFYHSNYVKVKRPRGAVIGGGLASVELDLDDGKLIGSAFSDPRGAVISSEVPQMNV
jgi:hypothetical protein